jgi:hypothetical protein
MSSKEVSMVCCPEPSAAVNAQEIGCKASERVNILREDREQVIG